MRYLAGLRLASALLAAASLGCGTQSERSADFDWLSTLARERYSLAYVVNATELDRAALDKVEAAAKRCMQERGWDEPAPFIGESPAAEPTTDPEFDPTYNKRFVGEFGYGIAIPSPLNGGVQPSQAMPMPGNLSPTSAEQYQRDLLDQHHGCRPQAVRQLRGGKTLPNVDGAIFEEVEERAFAQQDVLTALTEWQACIQVAGYDFASPREARQHIRRQHLKLSSRYSVAADHTRAVRELVQEERQTAEADWACYERFLEHELKAARRTAERELIAERPVLRDLVVTNLRMLERVEADQ